MTPEAWRNLCVDGDGDSAQIFRRSALVALSETGALLDPTLLVQSGARWSWFMLWRGDFATTESWNDDVVKQAVYASDFVVTLDELPQLGAP